MAKRKSSSDTKRSSKQKTENNSLVANINKRKKAKKSRSKKNSTVSAEAYEEMKQGWPKQERAKKSKKTDATK